MEEEISSVVPRAGNWLEFEDLSGFLAIGEVSSFEFSSEATKLETELQELTRSEHEELWQRVLEVIGDLLPRQACMTWTPSLLSALKATAVLLDAFARSCLDAKKVPVLPPAFLETARRCQDLLLSIPDAYIQGLIARALEKICTDSFENREDFYGGVLMFLVCRCLEARATGADASRLYRVRGLLGELDWEHESIESLKMQLMRCAAHASFVRSNHGAEMLSIFYTVHHSFTTEVHNTVKNQVMYCRAASLKNYALGLFKAWKCSDENTKAHLENAVQDWVVLAIRTAKKSAERARGMLEEFHRHHHDEAVNEILCRLYGPLLWRSLKVANCQVRENAARLLQYTFPLIPNELGVAEKEFELAKQLRLLRETLEDPSEPVRRVGVSAASVILKNYWDVIPASEIAEIISVLMNRSACDKSAPLVRAAVAEGFSWILENPMSHPTLSAVLPQVAELLNDRTPVVRAAFVGLLHVVSKCKGVSVGTIVSNEALLLRLVSEHAEGQAERLQRSLQRQPSKGTEEATESKATPEVVARQLARLIAPSLFQQELAQQVSRCNYLLQNWPLALLALLAHVRDVASVAERVKLAAALFRFGLRETAKSQKLQEEGGQKVVSSMLRVVGVLLEGAMSGKDDPTRGLAEELDRFIYEHIREADFFQLLTASEVPETVRDDLLFAVAALDPARLPRTAELVSQELAEISRSTQAKITSIASLLRLAVRWNRLVSALEPAVERLQATAKRLRQRQAAPAEVCGALAVVEAVLRDPEARSGMLNETKVVSSLCKVTVALTKAFEAAWEAGITELREGRESPKFLGPSSALWPRLLGFVIRMALHLEHRTDSEVKLPTEIVGLPEHLAVTVTSPATLALLKSLEATAQTVEQPKKRQRTRKSISTPPDIPLPSDNERHAVLEIYTRLVEAVNANQFLNLRHNDEAPSTQLVEAPQKVDPVTSVASEHCKALEECRAFWISAAGA